MRSGYEYGRRIPPTSRRSAADDHPLADLRLHGSGKVREIYEDGDELIVVASDRISVYDVILPTEIPDKGRVLTQMSLFWFELTATSAPTTSSPRTSCRSRRLRDAGPEAQYVPGRVVVRGTSPGPAGGSAARRERSAVSSCRRACAKSDKLPEPIFTPATKAETGDHDENIDFDRAAEIIGDGPLMEELRRVSIDIYRRGAEHAAERGIILADTKFEFGGPLRGRDRARRRGAHAGLLALWPADDYEAGRSQASFDKQYVRDYSDSVGWDHTPPGPVADEVVENTRAKYVEAYERITERKLD